MVAIRQTLQRLWSGLFGTTSSTEANQYCLVGNIVPEHAFGESRALLPGTKHFTPGTKVYCLPPQWGDGYEKAIVIGICRKSRRWITVVMPTEHITNWRSKAVYQTTVQHRLRLGIEGFNAQWKTRREVERWAARLRQRDFPQGAMS